MNLIPEIVDRHGDLISWRHDLHRHPEIGFEEFRTAKVIAEKLTSFGIEIHEGFAKTGIVGVLRAGTSDRSVALRSDIDALNLQEENTFDHRSVHDGKMHGCGHDGHATMLLGAAQYLAAHPNFDGTVYFIFQPAEEAGNGGLQMIKDGLFDLVRSESIFGMHNLPGIEVGNFATRPGVFMASMDLLEIDIQGSGGHGAMPHLARNPINGVCEIISSLNEFARLGIDAQIPLAFSICQISGGHAVNVIPDKAKLAGSIRTYSDENQRLFEEAANRITDGICAARNLEGDVKYEKLYPLLKNAEKETKIAGKVAAKVVGDDRVTIHSDPIMASEDFAWMLNEKSGNYILIGNGTDSVSGCTVHNPNYDFNDEILPIGATYWVELVKEHL